MQNLTNMDAALKELYDGQTINNMVYADNPTLALLPKKTDFGGKYRPQPIITANSQGRSADFATAQANQTNVEVESFLLKRVRDYSVGTIDNETMLASATDKMAFLEGAQLAIDGAWGSIKNSLCGAIFRSGTGSVCQIDSISTGVVTLTNPNDITQIERTKTIQANATDGGTPRAALGYVIAVNRAAGTFTVSTSQGGSAATPSGWTAGDFILSQGDNNAKIKGFEAWLPATAPTSGDNFFNVDRSVDSRLYGLAYDGSAQSIEEALIDAAGILNREGGSPDVVITNHTSYSGLEKSLGSKVQYVDLKGPAEINFRGIMVNGPKGMLKVFPDRSCQANQAWMLQMNTWTLYSLGDAPQFLTYGDDTSKWLRVSDKDAGEVRIGYYAQLGCSAPGWNSNVKLSA